MPHEPTPEQQKILTAASESSTSLMISAYAGTGKTTTLTMLAEALPSAPSLALAFNVKIKQELERRFPAHFTVKTMNGLGHGAWARFLGRQPQVDDRKLGSLISSLSKSLDFPLDTEGWTTVRSLVTVAMQAGLVPSIFPTKAGFTTDTPANWQSLAEDHYLDTSERLRAFARDVLIASVKLAFGTGTTPTISFDDQIYLPTLYGASFPSFALTLVDEAQDLSLLQHEMVRKVSGKGRLIVVGDPRQAIYGFRGADTSSMEKLRALRPDWIDLPLTLTFRCPQAIVALQQTHAPGFTAAPSNLPGQIIDLRGKEDGWAWSDLPEGDLAVLCRNNAPLISLALKLLSKHIPCIMLGRDIGKGLASLAKKICPEPATPAPICAQKVQDWLEQEAQLAKANGREHKLSGLQDRAECLLAVLEHVPTAGDLQAKLKEIFSRDHGKVTLSSGHRAKGLEWQTVVHLDPWRLPSKFALRAAHNGHKVQLEQERNLEYVIETRTKENLVFANLKELVL